MMKHISQSKNVQLPYLKLIKLKAMQKALIEKFIYPRSQLKTTKTYFCQTMQYIANLKYTVSRAKKENRMEQFQQY